MKRIIRTIFSMALVYSLLPNLAFSEERKSIYGDEDNRSEYFSVSPWMKLLSDSVVSFWDAKRAVFDPVSKTLTLRTEKLGDKLKLCPGEKFREQPIGAFCSGSLVGADLVMTAGHCIIDAVECANTKLVFGYAIKNEGGQAPTQIAQEEVYNCDKIVEIFQGAEAVDDSAGELGPDYALIRLDRKVKGHRALKINRKKTIKQGDAIFVIGHPVGLPLKITDGSTVRDAAPAGYFVTDLDTFGGNSGSPVFNAETRLVEGILVRGDEDFIQSPAGCTTVATYPQNGGRGEDVTKISELQAFIPSGRWFRRNPQPVVKTGTVKAVDIGNIAALRGLVAGDISFQ